MPSKLLEKILNKEYADIHSQLVEVGYTEDPVAHSFVYYLDWLKQGREASMSYLSDEEKRDKRSDLRKFYPEFQSALVFLFSYPYYPQEKNKIASYALGFEGKDYHHVLAKILQEIGSSLEIPFQISLDIFPVLERDLAYRAGLGWFGKNSMLIHPGHGSFFMIGSLLLSKKIPSLKKDRFVPPMKDHCGKCRACLDACPTSALDKTGKTRQVDSNKCISHFTIEVFGSKIHNPLWSKVPEGFEKTQEFFGCDICQVVCPWNRKVPQELEASFNKEELMEDLFNLSSRQIQKKLSETSLARTGKGGLLKNILVKKIET